MSVDGLGLETNCYLVQGTKFEVDRRYKILEPMSHSANGIVCSAEDKSVGERVAVKKIEGVFEHITITKRTLRELRILRHLQHENIMQVKNIFMTAKKHDFEELYVISELMETDLALTLRSSQVLSEDHCQFFMYQILRGMKYVHSAHVIHRDLKPRNLLVNSNCDLKICDFGLARVRFADKEWVCPMTEYVCTRWYRAPEVLCSWSDYSAAVDVWSIGCILAELHTREPLFPGHNTQHQLDLVIGILGSPEGEALMKIPNEKCRKFIRNLPHTPGKSFQHAFADMPPMASDLLSKMLKWDGEGRISVNDAIQDAFFESLHCPEDEPIREPLDIADFEFERRRITPHALREEIFRESLFYYPDLLEAFDRENASRVDITQFRLLVAGESHDSSGEESRGSDDSEDDD